ncbi:hypothetical protein ACQPYE_06900 [Actinosynnema sp. CA-299493]
MADKIEGKVAKILTPRELVINRGSNHGVDVGMQFAVLNPLGVDVKDPDTGEILGSIEVPKVIVKVVRVSPTLSVAGTFRKFRTGGSLGLTALAGMVGHEYVEDLKTDSRMYKEELNPKDSYVHIGDPVIETTGDEFSGWGEFS